MPYNRRNNRKWGYTNPRNDRKYGGARRTWRQYKRNKGYGGVAYDALKIATYAASQLNVEKKHTDSAASITPNDIGLTFYLMNGIALGDGNENRDGSSLRMQSLHVKGHIKLSGSASSTILRVLVILDKAPDGAPPSSSEILDDQDVNGMYNTEQMGNKYVILKDMLYTVSDGGNNNEVFKIYLKRTNKVRYDGNGAAIGDVSQNAVWLAFISDEATNTPTVTWRSRVMFVDN